MFLALTVSRTAQERFAAIQRELDKYLANWHFIPPPNFHMTMRFFGEVPEVQIDEIRQACGELMPQIEPFSMRWDHVEFFGTPQNARVIFVAAQPCNSLTRLADMVQKRFPDPNERKQFRPHITLAKARQHLDSATIRINANMLRRLRDIGRIGPEPLDVDISTVHREFVLMETIWVGRAVEYVVRDRYTLAPAAD